MYDRSSKALQVQLNFHVVFGRCPWAIYMGDEDLSNLSAETAGTVFIKLYMEFLSNGGFVIDHVPLTNIADMHIDGQPDKKNFFSSMVHCSFKIIIFVSFLFSFLF